MDLLVVFQCSTKCNRNVNQDSKRLEASSQRNFEQRASLIFIFNTGLYEVISKIKSRKKTVKRVKKNTLST